MQKKSLQKKKGEITLDILAGMVARGFSVVDQRMSGLEDRFDGLEDRFVGFENKFVGLEGKFTGLEERLTQKITGLENRIDDLAMGRATRDEVRILDARVTRLEKKIKV